MTGLRPGLLLAVGVMAWAGPVCGQEQKTTETKLGPLSEDVSYVYTARTPDGWRMAMQRRVEDKVVMVTDGTSGPEYDAIKHPRYNGILMFSNDCRRFGYVAVKDNRQVLVVDGKPTPPYYSLNWLFSPDGKRVAYSARVAPGEPEFVVADGKRGPDYDYVGRLIFSPDSRHLAYQTRKGKMDYVVLEGKAAQAYDCWAWPFFSPDSQHLAWMSAGGNGGRMSVGPSGPRPEGLYAVVDGTPVFKGLHVWLKNPTFNPVGGRLACEASRDQERFIAVDGKLGPAFDEIGHAGPVFSADGKHVGYSARRGKKWMVVIDGNVGPGYDEVWGPVFSPDGTRYAYTTRRGKTRLTIIDGRPAADADGMPLFSPNGKHLVYRARKDGGVCVVYDGKPGPVYGGVLTRTPLFSPDGSRYAYAANSKQSRKWSVVVDGKSDSEFDRIVEHTLVFSPDGTRYAYLARTAGKSVVVVDGKQGAPFERWKRRPERNIVNDARTKYPVPNGKGEFAVIDCQLGHRRWRIIRGKPFFSPDGRHVAYIIGKEGKPCVVKDGRPGRVYDDILCLPIFLKDGRVDYIAMMGRDLYHVRQ